jgi:hypothetical protein
MWEPAAVAIRRAVQLADLQQLEQWLQNLQDTIRHPDSQLQVSGEFFLGICAFSSKLWQLLAQEQPSELLQQEGSQGIVQFLTQALTIKKKMQ